MFYYKAHTNTIAARLITEQSAPYRPAAIIFNKVVTKGVTLMPIRCARCSKSFPPSQMSKDGRKRNGLHSWCKLCKRTYSTNHNRDRRHSDPAYRLWFSTRVTSNTKGLEHSILVEDVKSVFTEICPYLNIALNYDRHERGKVPRDAATVDRIDPTKGYIPGNIQILSFAANRMKSNFPIPELIEIAKRILSIHDN